MFGRLFRLFHPRTRCAAWAIVLLGAMLLPPSRAGAGIGERAFETRLSNGLKVIGVEDHKSPLVSFQVWYRAGARYEGWGKSGLAHLLEHMMFKGTRTVSGADFTRTINENGGEYNAFTGHDYAAYFVTLHADRVQVAIDLEADRMHNLVLSEQDFQTERMVVIEERRLRTEDNPQAYLEEQVDSAAYQAQPYHWPVAGWIEDLDRLTLADVEAFYRSCYNPASATIVVVGDIHREDLVARLEKVFGPIPKGVERARVTYKDPPQTGERRVVAERPAQLAAVITGFHVPNLGSPDAYVLEVIEAVLSQGKSSRLYEELVRQKELALEASADYSLTSTDPGLFYVSASVIPGKDPEAVEKALTGELEKLKTAPVGERELEKAKNQLEAGFVFAQDSLFSQGMMVAQYEIASDWRLIDSYVPSIRKVTREDIQRVANEYFNSVNRTVGVLAPAGAPAEKEPEGTPGPVKEHTVRLIPGRVE
jgi:zinc protease